MMPLSSAATAQRLGVSVRRVQALIQAGRLPAHRLGREWLVSSDALDEMTPRGSGRPLASSNAWALLALLAGEHPSWIASTVLPRLKRYTRQADALVRRLTSAQSRARVLRLRVLPADLNEIARERLVRTGLSAAHELDLAVAEEALDAYVDTQQIARIQQRFSPLASSDQPNLILRVPSHPWILEQEADAPSVVVAADLLFHRDPRVARAASNRVREAAHGLHPE